MLYPYDQRAAWPALAARAEERMSMHWPGFVSAAPTEAEVTMKYFDADFGHTTDFEDVMDLDPQEISCPGVEKVLCDQELEPETVRWFFAMLGRLLFDVGELDNWQVLLFLKGVAGSGKSTIAQIVKYLYAANQVGVLSSNAEAKFWLAPLYDKKLVLCPEAKRDFGISQGDLQSMVLGEEVSVPIKYKSAETVTWTAPMLFCGNEIPNWQDASGSMTRRLLMMCFRRKIKAVEPGLLERMRERIGSLILRMSVSYLQAVILCGDRGVWDMRDGKPILPEQILGFRQEMILAVQPLAHFLLGANEVELCHNNPALDLSETFMTEDGFVSQFKGWCKATGHQMPVWSPDTYQSVFEEYGISRLVDTRVYEGAEVNATFLIGLRMAER